jgi:CRP/FNR family transcriptional regulator, cyclic AMP receptor protein
MIGHREAKEAAGREFGFTENRQLRTKNLFFVVIILWRSFPLRISLEEFQMACTPEVLRQVPLFALLDDDETAVLASQVEVKTFAPRQRIWKIGDPSGQAYVMVSGMVRVTVVDEDHQEIVVDEPAQGEFFGFASMLDQTPHQSNAIAVEESVCVEVDRHDISILLERKPHAGMDMLAVLGRQFHASQRLVRLRASRNPNVVIEARETIGERVADTVASFGGSWTFIIAFGLALATYTVASVFEGQRSWDPYPFILLNLFLSMLAAIQAPIIMMSQNRQDSKDRVRSELDYEVNRRAAADIQGLARKLNLLGEQISDLEDLIRDKPIVR